MASSLQLKLAPSREKVEAISGRFAARLRALWYWLIVKNVQLTGMIVFVVGLLGVLAAAAYLVWFLRGKPIAPETKTVERGLNTVLVDRLELWIEEVDTQQREGLNLPNRALFVVDDLKLEDGI